MQGAKHKIFTLLRKLSLENDSCWRVMFIYCHGARDHQHINQCVPFGIYNRGCLPLTSDHFNLIWVQQCDTLQRVWLPLRPTGTLQWKMTWRSIYYSQAPMTNSMHEGKQVWGVLINVLGAYWWETNLCLVLLNTLWLNRIYFHWFLLACSKKKISLYNTQIFFQAVINTPLEGLKPFLCTTVWWRGEHSDAVLTPFQCGLQRDGHVLMDVMGRLVSGLQRFNL